MKRLVLALLALSLANAADRHFWLLTQTNVIGLPQTNAPTIYGVQVFCGTDDPATKGWDIALEVVTKDGEHRTFTGYLKRTETYADVPYSDVWVAWVGESMEFRVERLEVK